MIWTSERILNYPNLRGLPGPVPHVPLGNVTDLKSGLRQASIDFANRYGPFALMWVADQPVVWVHDPVAIGDITGAKSGFFFKDEPVSALAPGVTGPDMFTSNEPDWNHRRADGFLSDPRASGWLEDIAGPTRAAIGDRLARDLPMVERTHLEDWLFRLVWDLMSRHLFGRELGDGGFKAYNRVMDVMNFRLTTLLPVLPPGFARTKRAWVKCLDAAMAEVRAEPNGTSMAHQVARHSRIPLGEQAGTIANAFPGGVYSVTATIAETLLQLSAHPDVLENLRSRLPGPGAPYAELAGNEALDAVLRETMRVASSVPAFLRRTRDQPVTVGSVTLDPHVRVVIGSAGLHHDATHWPDPGTWRPGRWTSEVSAANPYGSGYFFPFGRGARSCYGQELGLFQVRLVLHALLGTPGRHLAFKPPQSQGLYFGCCMPKGLVATIR